MHFHLFINFQDAGFLRFILKKLHIIPVNCQQTENELMYTDIIKHQRPSEQKCPTR